MYPRTPAAMVIGMSLALGLIGSAGGQQGSWASGPPVPTPRAEVAVAEMGGQVYVLGGGVGPSLQANEVFDSAAQTWASRAAMPQALNHHGAASLNNRLYVFGGFDPNGRPTTAALEYDPSSDDHFVLASAGGWLYSIGGRIGNFARNVDTVEVYDPSAGLWSFATPMPEARSGITGAVVGSQIYVFGGEDPAQTHGEVFVYDTASDSWGQGAPMPTPRHGLGAATIGGSISVLAGGLRPGGGSDTDTHEIFTP